MNNNNIEELRNVSCQATRTIVSCDKDGVRSYKDKDTGEVVKALRIYNGGVSDEQIKSWKSEHRKVHMIEVEDDGDLFVGYFRRPSMETMSAVNSLAKKDEIKSTTILFDNCWLGGEPVMKTDTLVRMGAIRQLGELFNSITSRLKNV